MKFIKLKKSFSVVLSNIDSKSTEQEKLLQKIINNLSKTEDYYINKRDLENIRKNLGIEYKEYIIHEIQEDDKNELNFFFQNLQKYNQNSKWRVYRLNKDRIYNKINSLAWYVARRGGIYLKVDYDTKEIIIGNVLLNWDEKYLIYNNRVLCNLYDSNNIILYKINKLDGNLNEL